MATSRRTFLGVTVGAAASTMVPHLANAVILSDQNATATPAPAVARVHAGQLANSFDPDKAFMETGLGLISMKERLKLVDGHLSNDSKPWSGTTVRASVPLRAQMKATAAMAGAAVVPGQPSP